MDEKQKQLNEEMEIIKELVQEISHKYNCYVSVFCFPESNACGVTKE